MREILKYTSILAIGLVVGYCAEPQITKYRNAIKHGAEYLKPAAVDVISMEMDNEEGKYKITAYVDEENLEKLVRGGNNEKDPR